MKSMKAGVGVRQAIQAEGSPGVAAWWGRRLIPEVVAIAAAGTARRWWGAPFGWGWVLAVGWVCGLPFESQAQHGHLDAGAAAPTPGAPLVWANGADFLPATGYVKTLTFTNEGRFAGYFEGGITPTALPTTAAHGGPDARASAPGSFLQFGIVRATGPVGGRFGYWEAGSTSPTLTLLAGDTSAAMMALSESDGSPGSDPYGHIHGRRFTATRAGVYTAWFQVFDTSTNGAGGKPIHPPSDPLPIRFLAGTPTLVNEVGMGGGMVHVNIEYADHDGDRHFHVHVDQGVPVLTPLALAQPDTQFAPTAPWFEDLDPSLGGMAFNRQYGFLMDPAGAPLPAGHSIVIRQVSASPGLEAYTYRKDPAAWQPMFGTAGSPDTFAWNLMMFHPAYAIAPNSTGTLTATYEVILMDAQNQATPVRAPFTLQWTVASGLTLGQPHVEDATVHLPVTVPAAWQGYTYRLERTRDLQTWFLVEESKPAGPGTIDLHDSAPTPGFGVYRVRPDRP